MQSETASDVLFRETQRFTQLWIRLIAASAALLPTLLFGWGFYEQLIVGRPWGRAPMSDAMLLALGLTVIALGWGAFLLLIITVLTVEVNRDGVWVQFWPFHRKPWRVDFEGVTNIEALGYRPILDYGGWGIRFVRHGRAYNVRGDRGVRIDYDNGRHLLIGSQRADDLAQAIREQWLRGDSNPHSG